MARMARAGLRPDDASIAARVAIREFVRERDNLIRQARRCRLSLRAIGQIFGISYEHVRGICQLTVVES